MSEAMKVGLVLSGGGAIGAYEVGVVKALAESGTEVHAVSGASIGALNGAILASAPNLHQAAERMAEIWQHLGKDDVLAVNKSVYLSLLLQFGIGMGLNPVFSWAGGMLGMLLRQAASLAGKQHFLDKPMLSDQPLINLMNQYLDVDALASGLPLYISVFPTDGSLEDIANCIRAELGLGNTKESEFLHVQNLPASQQKDALMASAALPLLFKPREINGTRYSDGGMGGWESMQGNTPITPLVEAGCNLVIVTHLTDGSMWDRHVFPGATVLEIRPRHTLARNEGPIGGVKDLLGFKAMHIDSWIAQGYEETLAAIERISKPLQTRQFLRTSEATVESSLERNVQADNVLSSGMSRLK